MEKVSKFLGADGLTSTSANHIANIAKEMYESLEAKVQSVRLYSRDYTLAVKGNSFRLENESTREELAAVADSIKEIAALKSLIAWLREGIKAKDDLSSEEKEQKYIRSLIKDGRKDLDENRDIEDITLTGVLAKMGEETMARYYALEAKCATLGKFIHADGSFAKARKNYFDVKKNPTSISGKGQDAEISTYTTSFTDEEVDSTFFDLQKKYRSLQAELNRLKADVDSAFRERTKEQIAETRRYNQERELAVKEVLLERTNEIKALKIVIPESLRGIYEKVNAVASAK